MPMTSDGSDLRKAVFVRLLAEYLVGDQVAQSIRLEMGDPGALEWQKLRSAAPLFGYPTCTGSIDREKLQAEIARVDVPETAKRAARNSVFCSLRCAFEDFASAPPSEAGR
jgi:hypothetical protein